MAVIIALALTLLVAIPTVTAHLLVTPNGLMNQQYPQHKFAAASGCLLHAAGDCMLKNTGDKLLVAP